jgi:hypothetical protein
MPDLMLTAMSGLFNRTSTSLTGARSKSLSTTKSPSANLNKVGVEAGLTCLIVGVQYIWLNFSVMIVSAISMVLTIQYLYSMSKIYMQLKRRYKKKEGSKSQTAINTSEDN